MNSNQEDLKNERESSLSDWSHSFTLQVTKEMDRQHDECPFPPRRSSSSLVSLEKATVERLETGNGAEVGGDFRQDDPSDGSQWLWRPSKSIFGPDEKFSPLRQKASVPCDSPQHSTAENCATPKRSAVSPVEDQRNPAKCQRLPKLQVQVTPVRNELENLFTKTKD